MEYFSLFGLNGAFENLLQFHRHVPQAFQQLHISLQVKHFVKLYFLQFFELLGNCKVTVISLVRGRACEHFVQLHHGLFEGFYFLSLGLHLEEQQVSLFYNLINDRVEVLEVRIFALN